MSPCPISAVRWAPCRRVPGRPARSAARHAASWGTQCIGLVSSSESAATPSAETKNLVGINRRGHPLGWIRVWLSILRRLDTRLWLILGLNFGHHFFFAGVFFATFGLYLRTILGESVQLGTLALGVASLTATLLLVRNSITVLTGPLLGYLSDLLGDRRRVLILGLLCGVGALVVLAFGRSLWLIVLGVLLAAVTYGVVPPMLLSWMGDLTRSGERGAIVGGYQTMGDLGSGLGPLAAYALIAIWPLPTLYAGCALVLGATVLIIVRTRNDSGK